jgi:hypothetical protein
VKLVALGETLALMGSRFRPPAELSAFFRTPVTDVNVYVAAHTYWVAVDKTDLHHT